MHDSPTLDGWTILQIAAVQRAAADGREDLLSREVAELQRRCGEAEARQQEAAARLPEATAPLLRQIEAMQVRSSVV